MKHDNHNGPIHDHTSKSNDIFDNPDLFLEKFDGAQRDEWQKPDEVVEAFNISSDAVVVEIGAGTGYFTVRLAEHVKDGHIFAYDQAPKMAEYLRGRVDQLGINNVEVRTTESDGSLAIEESVDFIFSVDVYHHLHDRISYFAKLQHHLKPNGLLVIIDRTEEKVEGQPSGHRVPATVVKHEMQEAGFELVQELDILQPVQYYLAFKRVE